MALRTDYPYDEALDDITDFIERRVKNAKSKQEILDYLKKCRQGKTVTFRYIHEQYIKYANENQDYLPISEQDNNMIDDLFHFWG